MCLLGNSPPVLFFAESKKERSSKHIKKLKRQRNLKTGTKMNNKELKNLALEDLERSGLNKNDYKKMGLQVCNEDQASAVLGSSFCTFGYVIPYYDYKGKLTNNIRFKFLEDLKGKKDKIVKYSQPKGTKPYLYFPTCINWKKILNDSKITITFTEGEKKSYAACKAGIPTIGLSGVWSFKSKKLQKPLIKCFDNIKLTDRNILICFDNDLQSNDDVLKASRSFAKELHNAGAKPLQKLLPFDPYSKIGLDDYLLTHTKKDYEKLECESFLNITEVKKLDEEIAYIESIGKFYIFKSDLFASASNLKTDIFPYKTYKDDGETKSIVSDWLNSESRRTHTRLTYKPAQPKTTIENEYNLWDGWGCEPERGNIKPFLDAVDKIFNKDKDLIKWFLDWVAYPIQNPATKMLTAILLQSIEQGTGKSSIGLCIGSMYGSNYALIDDQQLHGTFNEWAVNKQFVLGDEISGKDKRAESDSIKNLITRPSITINKKYMPTYSVPDCINYLFTSNHPDALSIEPDDRRFFVHRIKYGDGLTLNQGMILENFRTGKGKNYLLNYFINDHVISDKFDHRSRPPMTDAKSELIDASLTDIERWLYHIKTNPKHALKISGVEVKRDLFTTSQVVKLYELKHPKSNVTTTAMGKALNKIFSDSEAIVINTKSEGSQRVRALKNIDKWESASHKDMQEHYDENFEKMERVKKSKLTMVKK